MNAKLKDIAESKVSITLVPKESLALRVSRDLFTLASLGLCVYVSRDSSFFTLITGSIFIVFTFCRAINILKENTTVFKDKDAAIKYLENL